MRLLINGEAFEMPFAAATLLAVLQHLGYLPDDAESFPGRFVVALNQHIISASQYRVTALQEDDCIDVLSVITGG